MIQVERADLTLRAENLYALGLAGISADQEELLTLTETSRLDLDLNVSPFPAHNFALVDHNRLADAYTRRNPQARVVAVIDHHEDEGLYEDARPRIVSPAGSCASHVATHLPLSPLPDVATLLLTAILVDTDGLKPDGKATQVDRQSAVIVATHSTISDSILSSGLDDPNALYGVEAIKELTKTLDDKKGDVSRLAGYDLLRRDYKEYTVILPWAPGKPEIKVGLSTVPAPLSRWKDQATGYGDLEKDAIKWMAQRGVTVLGVLTSFRDAKDGSNLSVKTGKKGKHQREQAWFVLSEPELSKLAEEDRLTAGVLAKRLFRGLEADKELELEKHKKIDVDLDKDLGEAKVYRQGNAKATRKVAAPVVKRVLDEERDRKNDKK